MLLSNAQGEAVAYALFNLQDRGPMMIDPGTRVYRGMIVGEHTRGNDLEINVLKGKQLTNIRASGKDEATVLTPPMKLSLERALSYIEEDELVEVTPKSIRLRKAILDPNERKRAERARAKRHRRLSLASRKNIHRLRQRSITGRPRRTNLASGPLGPPQPSVSLFSFCLRPR